MYAKDFLFQQALPEWMKDMDSKLPSYLKTEGKEDMLHYPPKRFIMREEGRGEEGGLRKAGVFICFLIIFFFF